MRLAAIGRAVTTTDPRAARKFRRSPTIVLPLESPPLPSVIATADVATRRRKDAVEDRAQTHIDEGERPRRGRWMRARERARACSASALKRSSFLTMANYAKAAAA